MLCIIRMNKTGKAIMNSNMELLENYRCNEKLDYKTMSTAAIYRKMDILEKMYEWALEDVTTILVSRGLCPIEEYMNDSVLPYVMAYNKQDDEERAIKFLNEVRQHQKVNYNELLYRVAKESRKISNIKKIVKYAKLDKCGLNYQDHITQLYNYKKICMLLKEYADSEGYEFDFNEMAKHHEDIRLIREWNEAKEKPQTLTIDCHKKLEEVISRNNVEVVKDYLNEAIKTNQEIDYSRLLDLPHISEVEEVIYTYIPTSYVFPEYDKELKINIAEDPKYAEDLIRYAYETTSISSVVYEGLHYYERSNIWGGESESRPEYDPDISCGNYSLCEVIPDIYPEDGTKVEYILHYDKSEVYFNETYENEELIRKLLHCDPYKTQLNGYERIVLENMNGENMDHRGSDHCKVNLAFYDSYDIVLPITLYEFMKACYRIKSHKYDKWYELYCGADVSEEGEVIYVSVIYDHGS